MTYGKTPFKIEDNNVESIFKLILQHRIEIQPYSPNNIKISSQLKDLLKRILIYEYGKRLGAKGAAEIKNHPFFEDVNFQLLHNLPPPK